MWSDAGEHAEREEDEEREQVAAQRGDVAVDLGALVAPARNASAEPAITSIASVASTNGAPMIAPIAISTASSLPPPLISATIGMIDSGSAVPTAASSAPTAPSPRLRRCPSHSTALVKPIAPATMSTNAPSSSRATVMRSRAPR